MQSLTDIVPLLVMLIAVVGLAVSGSFLGRKEKK